MPRPRANKPVRQLRLASPAPSPITTPDEAKTEGGKVSLGTFCAELSIALRDFQQWWMAKRRAEGDAKWPLDADNDDVWYGRFLKYCRTRRT